MKKTALLTLLFSLSWAASAVAQGKPPFDVWTDDVMTKIRDKSSLDSTVDSQFGYAEVNFTSTTEASYFDSKDPYAEHTGEKIRIHGYLAYPLLAGQYPAIVLCHGRGGHADLGQAQSMAGLGIVVLAIDGPTAGKSTGGPTDDMQAWISVDKGATYSYLYHFAYAAMRSFTLLESLAEQTGNPYKIDAANLGVIGVNSGGVVASIVNSVDTRSKAAVLVATAGNYHHTLRYSNSWLYHDLYVNTRTQPYSGSDPLNSISNIDTDSTLTSFLTYFDPIRYAPQQNGPVLIIMGTHDEYSPLPNANLQAVAVASSGAQSLFDKRLWLVQNATYSNLSDASLMSVSSGIKGWLDYCFGKRGVPLVSPAVSLVEATGGMQFVITISDTASRIAGSTVQFYAATRIDSTGITPYTPIKGFTSYPVIRSGTGYLATIVDGEQSSSGDAYTTQNVIYYATVVDALGMPVSSLVYKGKQPMDLSTDFTPVLEHQPGDQTVVPVPETVADAAHTVASSVPLSYATFYQGMALSNPTQDPMTVRIEARSTDGRHAIVDGLASPVILNIPPRSEQIFVADQYMGQGASHLNGSFHIGWSDKRGSSLLFRGATSPSQLDGIGPLIAPGKSLFVPLVPEQDPSYYRFLEFFSTSSSASAVTITYRTALGEATEKGQVIVPPWGRADLLVNVNAGTKQIASVQIEATVPVSARIEVVPSRDSWSIDALPAPSASRFIQPHAEYRGTYKTRFVVMNTSPTGGKRYVKFKRHKPAGDVLGNEVTLTLDNSQTASIPLETMFNVPSSELPGYGWVEANVDGGGGGILIYAMANDSAHGGIAVSPVGSGDSGTLSMPYFVERAGYWTGLAIANPGNATVTADIVAYGDKGEVLAEGKVTLGAAQSKTQVVSQWLPNIPPESMGQVMITTSSPLHLLAYFGTSDNSSFAAIPLTPVP